MTAHKYGSTPQYEHLSHKSNRTNRLTNIKITLAARSTQIIGASGK
jgi:hypothetical protein